MMPRDQITKYLNLFPEVTWDRFSGDIGGDLHIYGWIPRDDGRADFMVLHFDEDGPWMYGTSSAKFSKIFNERLQPGSPHSDCQRVEEFFPEVKSVKLTIVGTEQGLSGDSESHPPSNATT